MNTFMKNVSMLAIAAMAGMSITSCTADKNLFDPEQAEKNVKAEYAANFVKKFGTISPTQIWDYTDPSEAILPGTQHATKATRVAKPVITPSTDWYRVDHKTLGWMKSTLTESKDNSGLGNPFKMSMPNNTFTIVPIYVGKAGMTWDLHMVTVGADKTTEDVLIWRKGQSMRQKINGQWTNLDAGSHTMDADEVEAIQYTVSGVPQGTEFYFYLVITYGVDNWAKTGKKQTSIEHMMLALNVPNQYHPTNIPEGSKVMIVGCEDANLSRSDWDYNDVVFMVYGKPDIPTPERIEDYDEVKECRYMIEDLGATDDFDFNDIVIDVNETRHVHFEYDAEGKLIPEKTVIGDWTQKATLKHLGGTLPYQVKIGNTTLPWTEPALGKDMDLTTEIKGWNPDTHNISATVQGKNGGYVEIPFPKKGEVPMIIAMKTTKQWKSERNSITPEWFNE